MLSLDYSNQPDCSLHLVVRQAEPINHEAKPEELVAYTHTPEEHVYLRNHGPVPVLDDALELTVEGDVQQPLKMAASELLMFFPIAEVTAAMQCAGNRRKVMSAEYGQTQGVQWGEGTVCNGTWAGVRLRDVLIRAGVDVEKLGGNAHVHFESHAAGVTDDKLYGGSIPFSKAFDAEGDVLLATHLNGKHLTKHHGFPLRVVVPGYSGARWVKWLTHVRVSKTESTNFYQQLDYKIVPEHVRCKEAAETWWPQLPSLNEMPLNSVISSIRPLPASSPPSVLVKGYALPSSHGAVKAVEVSMDAGRTWHAAKITYIDGRWSWAIWEFQFQIDDSLKSGIALSRAIDVAGHVQAPTRAWNIRGLCYDGYGRKDWSF